MQYLQYWMMDFVTATLVFGAVIWVNRVYWERILVEDEPWPNAAWFIGWVIKGGAVPVIFWVLLNRDALPGIHPIAPGSTWTLAAAAMFFTAWAWSVVSFAWLIVAAWEYTIEENRIEFRGFVAMGALILLPLLGVLLYSGLWAVAGLLLLAALIALAHFVFPLVRLRKAKPTYSGAIGRMKQDKFGQAETEILRQLETCDEDFDGWLLLAELYAVHYHDLVTARETIWALCDQPNVTASQASTALHRLADWQLKFTDDPEPARQALEEIWLRYPETHLAQMARLRWDQIPPTREALQAERRPKVIRTGKIVVPRMPAMGPRDLLLSASAAREAADENLHKVQNNPRDVGAREKLAQLWAEHLNEPVRAIEQLDVLLGMPGQPDKKRAEWLSRMAAWQLKYCRDEDAARAAFERLLRELPQADEAGESRRQLQLMDAEKRLRARLKVTPAG